MRNLPRHGRVSEERRRLRRYRNQHASNEPVLRDLDAVDSQPLISSIPMGLNPLEDDKQGLAETQPSEKGTYTIVTVDSVGSETKTNIWGLVNNIGRPLKAWDNQDAKHVPKTMFQLQMQVGSLDWPLCLRDAALDIASAMESAEIPIPVYVKTGQAFDARRSYPNDPSKWGYTAADWEKDQMKFLVDQDWVHTGILYNTVTRESTRLEYILGFSIQTQSERVDSLAITTRDLTNLLRDAQHDDMENSGVALRYDPVSGSLGNSWYLATDGSHRRVSRWAHLYTPEVDLDAPSLSLHLYVAVKSEMLTSGGSVVRYPGGPSMDCASNPGAQ